MAAPKANHLRTEVSIRYPAHDIWQHDIRSLEPFFKPRGIAVIGATEREGSVGRSIFENLLPYGKVYPVNPKHDHLLKLASYPSVKEIPHVVDLAVVVTPAATVPAMIQECIDAGIKAAIVISAGFKEVGPSGVELEEQILESANQEGLRVIGPNCLGLMVPALKLNATFASRMARPGNVAFISQSGALCTAILDWSFKAHVGFSAFASIGSMLDVDWGDLIDYLGNDPNTQSILIYMETVGNPRSFISAARGVALTKPIIVLKAGRTQAAAQAASSHTGALAGSDEALDAMFRRCGVLRVNEIKELFNLADVLAKQPRPGGPRLAILTNAGGPGVLATDELVRSGGKLAALSETAAARLNEFLPPHWSRANPIDILGDASPDRYEKALSVVLSDSGNDGALVILTPQAMSDPAGTAAAVIRASKGCAKPVLASWMGGEEVEAAKKELARADIPVFDYPDQAAQTFQYMWSYSDNLNALYETPEPAAPLEEESYRNAAEKASRLIQEARQRGRTLLTEFESKELLKLYGLAVNETHFANNEEEAVRLARTLGFPVAVKLCSETITHKTDVGGVKLDLRNEQAAAEAYRAIQASVENAYGGIKHFQGVTVQPMIKEKGYELIVGSSVDPQLGPVLLFGSGGIQVEAFRDYSLGLPPLNTTLARRVIERTRIYEVLKNPRDGEPVDLQRLEAFLVAFSQLVAEQRWIREVDINPLFVSPSRILALDARVVLHDPGMAEANLPKLAIRPYPREYVTQVTAKDGSPFVLRPIRPEDEPLLIEFHKTLSQSSIRQRFFKDVKLDLRTAHQRLVRRCMSDFDREIAIVVERADLKTSGHKKIAGVGRLSRARGAREAKLTMLVADPFQNLGLGNALLARLLEIGRLERLERVFATMLGENEAMRHMCEKAGFHIYRTEEDNAVIAEFRF